MELSFGPNGTLIVDDARIAGGSYRNFEGRASKFNREGDRSFALILPNQEIVDMLVADVNEYGNAWNVKIRAPKEEGDEPFMFLPVKVKFNEWGPKVYLKSGESVIQLDEETVGMLDDIDISSVDMEIAPSDGMVNGKGYRAAYLRSIWVTQYIRNDDRFASRFAEHNAQ